MQGEQTVRLKMAPPTTAACMPQKAKFKGVSHKSPFISTQNKTYTLLHTMAKDIP